MSEIIVLSMRAECTQSKGAIRGGHPGRRGCGPADGQDAKGRMKAKKCYANARGCGAKLNVQRSTLNAKSNQHRNYRIGIMCKREKRAGFWRDWQKRKDDRDPRFEPAVGRQAPGTDPEWAGAAVNGE